MAVSTPVTARGRSSEAIGILVNHYDFELINGVMTGESGLKLGALTQRRGLGETGETYLVDQSGTMITDSLFVEDAAFRQKVETYPVGRCLRENLESIGTWPDYRGVPVAGASMCITGGDFKWVLITEQDVAEAFAQVENMKKISIVLTLSFFIIAVLAARSMAKSIADPLKALHDGTEIIGGGDLDHRIGLDRDDELGLLSRAFDTMTQKLNDRTVELNKTLYREKELGELKTRFISMASHEFRTPLTSILSSSDIIKRYAARMTEEERAERIDKIQSEVTHMTEMLEDVLIIGKAEAGKLEFKPRAFDLKKLCRAFAEGALFSAGESHDVEFSWAGECDDVMGDEKLLKNILSNLLSNAVKYSPDGGKVLFDVSCDEETAVFLIKDEGIGIPEKDMKRLFTPFHRGKNTGDIPGTGLGLAITKNSVDLHGGTIEVDSEAGKGTAFLVTIPVGKKGG
ncbi:MAG: HAMP domain-containing sensor histidine kinase [Thermodesulfobacteriota bacterium]